MNDYWNEPPETPEPPMCCGDYMDVLEDGGTCVCSVCGKKIEPAPDIEPADTEPWPPKSVGGICLIDAEEYEEATGAEFCPHGRPWGECGACDHAGDIAYNAAREKRLRR